MRPISDLDLERAVLGSGLLAPGDRVLVAVSSGADSTALAAILHRLAATRLPLELALAHLDHGWRGPAAAARDRAHVEALARRLDLELHQAGPPKGLRAAEAPARRWRYEMLARFARAIGARKLATGHHRGDQAETVLLRLERKSGPHGLQGIPARRPLGRPDFEVIRPLLPVPGRALRRWLEAEGIGWVEDETNQDATRDRARARQTLAAEAGLERRLVAAASRIRGRLERRRRAAYEHLQGAVMMPPGSRTVRIERSRLASLSPRLFEPALREWASRIGADRRGPYLTRRHVERSRELLAVGGALDLPGDAAVRVGPTRVSIHARATPTPDDLPRLLVRHVPRRSFDLEAFVASKTANEVALDAAALGPAPRLRHARRDDRFEAYGNPSGDASLSAWLAAQGVPGWLRARTAVLEGAGGLVWVPGYRESRAALVGPETRTVALAGVETAQP